MRGTEYNLMFTAMAAIVVAAVFAGGAFWLMQGIVETDVEQKTTFNLLRASDTAHLAKECLSKDGHISLEYLEELKSKGKPLGEECGMSVGFGLMMEDKDTGEEPLIYNYYTYGNIYSQPVFVKLKVGDEIHLGEMSVSIK